MTITFSREIFNPWLLYHPSYALDYEESSAKEPSRNLNDDFDVTGTFKLEVEDADFYPDLDKGLMSYRLVEIEGETTDQL